MQCYLNLQYRNGKNGNYNNIITGSSDYILVELEGNVIIGRLYPGDWCFFPYDGTLDIDIDTSAVGMKVEYGVFSQSVAS